MMTIHSQTICTASGGVAKLRISVMSLLSKSANANRAASNAGRAAASASSASAFSIVICLLFISTSIDFSEACSFFVVAELVALGEKGLLGLSCMEMVMDHV